MTYADTIAGDSKPVEFFEFIQGTTFYRVTSANVAQELSGNTYEPLEGLKRSEPVQDTEPTAGEIEIDVPATFTLADQFKGTIPSLLPSLTIYQRLRNDPDSEFVTVWKGTITSCSFSEHMAKLNGLPPTQHFAAATPRVVYSGLCNHFLYDNLCGVVRDDYRFDGSLTSVAGDHVTLSISGLRDRAAAIDSALGLGLDSDELDVFWHRGIVVADNAPQERRTIVESVVGGDPDVVRVNIPWREAGTGDSLIIFAGCAHVVDICNRKFQNIENFGGFPYVPGSTNNPFRKDLGNGQSKDGMRWFGHF